MAETYYFRDSNGRPCAILKAGDKKVIAWKSGSREDWFLAPFAVDILDDYWIAKKGNPENIAKVPSQIVKELERAHSPASKVPTLNEMQAKKLLRRHGLLRKSSEVRRYLNGVFGVREGEEEKWWKAQQGNKAKVTHVWESLVRAASRELEGEIQDFYSRMTSESRRIEMFERSVRKERFPRARRLARSAFGRKQSRTKPR